MQESKRQQKVAKQIQKDISEIFTKEAADTLRGVMSTVTTVRISPDLSFAKVYVSIFPYDKGEQMIEKLEQSSWMIRRALGTRVKNQLRIVPELSFFLDDSLEYLAHIDELLK